MEWGRRTYFCGFPAKAISGRFCLISAGVSNLFPHPPVNRAVSPAGGAASASTDRLAAKRNSQRAVFEGKGLALADRPEWVGFRRQNRGPLYAALFAAFDAVHLAVVYQQKSGLAGQLPLEDEFCRCVAMSSLLNNAVGDSDLNHWKSQPVRPPNANSRKKVRERFAIATARRLSPALSIDVSRDEAEARRSL